MALWSYNSIDWLVAFFAIVRTGGVAVLVNYSMGIHDAAKLLRSVGATYIICGDNGQTKRWDDALGTLAKASGIALKNCVDVRTGTPGLVSRFADAPGIEEVRTEDEAGETAFIIFTSGTTSRPKAVCVSQRALTCDAHAVELGLEGTRGQSICVSVPLFHILGLLTSYVYLTQGAKVCLPANYRADSIAPLISEHCVSDMAAVGAVYQALSVAEGFSRNVAPHLRTCLIAGGMTTPVQMMRMELDYANATFVNMYGQSEGAPLTMVRPSDLVEQRAGTVGRPVEGVELRIAAADGTPLPEGEVGEVLARGKCLMNGYDGMPASSQAIDAHGWLHTGDLGYVDELGNLHLAGRLKDVIIRGGENISPAEIEAEITKIDGVREAKVMGVPHPVFGESIEEMLSERIMDAYSGAGDIRMRLTLMEDWLRVTFSDDGAEYVIDKRRDTSLSARIILGSVDNFHTTYRQGKPEYHMDFLYDDNLDIKEFLVQNKLQMAEQENI